MATMHDNNETVAWPKRAVVTAGMPYGNKPLHFGHIAGVFVPSPARSWAQAQLFFAQMPKREVARDDGRRNWPAINAAAERALLGSFG